MQDGQCVKRCSEGWFLPPGSAERNGTCERECRHSILCSIGPAIPLGETVLTFLQAVQATAHPASDPRLPALAVPHLFPRPPAHAHLLALPEQPAPMEHVWPAIPTARTARHPLRHPAPLVRRADLFSVTDGVSSTAQGHLTFRPISPLGATAAATPTPHRPRSNVKHATGPAPHAPVHHLGIAPHVTTDSYFPPEHASMAVILVVGLVASLMVMGSVYLIWWIKPIGDGWALLRYHF